MLTSGGSNVFTIFRLMLFAFFISVFGLSALGRDAAAASTVNPCDGNFELEIVISTVGLDVGADTGLKLIIDKAGRAIASKMNSTKKGSIAKPSCQVWQKNYWSLLSRVIKQNNSKERKQFICRNVASVNFKQGGKKDSARICLGQAHEDAMTAAFHRFYEGTSHLASAPVGKR